LSDGIVESGDAQRWGIGTLKRERAAHFLEQMIQAGLYKPGEVDLSAVLVEQFVNRGTGLDLKRRLLDTRRTATGS